MDYQRNSTAEPESSVAVCRARGASSIQMSSPGRSAYSLDKCGEKSAAVLAFVSALTNGCGEVRSRDVDVLHLMLGHPGHEVLP